MAIAKAVPVANRLCAAAALMLLACSSSSPTGGAGGGKGGGGQSGGNGGTKVDAGGGGQSGGNGGNGGTKVDAGGGGQSGGNGGTKADGGGGQSGNGGANVDPLPLPGCLSDLLSTCSLAMPCAYSTNDAGGFSDFCFAAGATDSGGGAHATETLVPNPNGGNGDCTPYTLVAVAKADGSPCYSFEVHEPVEVDCTYHTWIWKDASGQTVATGRLQIGAEGGVAFNATHAEIKCAVGGEQTSCTVLTGGAAAAFRPTGRWTARTASMSPPARPALARDERRPGDTLILPRGADLAPSVGLSVTTAADSRQ